MRTSSNSSPWQDQGLVPFSRRHATLPVPEQQTSIGHPLKDLTVRQFVHPHFRAAPASTSTRSSAPHRDLHHRSGVANVSPHMMHLGCRQTPEAFRLYQGGTSIQRMDRTRSHFSLPALPRPGSSAGSAIWKCHCAAAATHLHARWCRVHLADASIGLENGGDLAGALEPVARSAGSTR